MSIWGDMKKTATDCWNGNPNMIGDAFGVGMDTANKVSPAPLPDFEETSNFVNHTVLNNSSLSAEPEGNWGNHLGTILGGGMGLAGGPGGAALGAGIGSSALGWLADAL